MKTSTEGLIALIGHEGIVLSRYKDSVGVWTIGVGHTKAAGGINPELFAGTLSLQQAIDLLRTDIVKYEDAVNKAVKVPLTQYEFDALVSFHYNTGAIASATLTKTLNSGDKVNAGKQFMNWVKPPEIKSRRQAERTLFLTGKYPPPLATIYPADKSGKVQWGKGARVNVRDLLNAGNIATPPLDKPPAPPAPPPAMPPQPTPEPAAPSGNWLSIILSAIAAAFSRKQS
ncbi:lysozyme [Rhizobium sp. BK251]|uniref:lysozyme n=1 Tax=Rhizobium sp. BK251 TaxID=2512125 RepID=UPI00104F0A2E|nr:lysozyme [Rhizobium sp. BK251]TCL70661.1 lysozyme [Rhizobium sp. BK251]